MTSVYGSKQLRVVCWIWQLTKYQYGTFLPPILTESLYGNWFEMVLPYWEYFKGKSNVLFVIYEDLVKVCIVYLYQLLSVYPY